MTEAETFKRALAGEDLAFAPIVWEELPTLVHQGGTGWWLEPATAQRLVVDAANVAGADAMFVRYDRRAVSRVAGHGRDGDEALELLTETEDICAGYELCVRLSGSAPFAVIAALPGVALLEAAFGASEREVAEDALVDLARGFLEAGAHALAVVDEDHEDVTNSVRRAASVGDFFGRPALGISLAGDDFAGWVEGAKSCQVVATSSEGDWPTISRGIVTTRGDISGLWDASRLRAVGSRRP